MSTLQNHSNPRTKRAFGLAVISQYENGDISYIEAFDKVNEVMATRKGKKSGLAGALGNKAAVLVMGRTADHIDVKRVRFEMLARIVPHEVALKYTTDNIEADADYRASGDTTAFDAETERLEDIILSAERVGLEFTVDPSVEPLDYFDVGNTIDPFTIPGVRLFSEADI